MMKRINKRLMKEKLKYYKKYKERMQEYDLNLKTKMPKYMTYPDSQYKLFFITQLETTHKEGFNQMFIINGSYLNSSYVDPQYHGLSLQQAP